MKEKKKESRIKQTPPKDKPAVLLVAGGMNTGGAETHIVSLATSLMQSGCFVAVASAGGLLSGELKKRGILEIRAPLDSRLFHNVFRSAWVLRRAILRYGFDVLHAHTRLSAFVSNLALGMGFKNLHRSVRFVTTAHLDFRLDPILKRLARWGERTLAVSEDLREYLIRGYGLSYDNIDLTVNGIDTARFITKDTPMAMAKGKDEPIEIVHVSRLDKDRALTAYLLVSLMPTLVKKHPVHLTIVGGGKLFYELSLRVERIKLISGDCIELVGEKDDVLPYLKRADIAVGVSRAALEAMSCRLPTILSGNDGFLGLFEIAKLDRAHRTNFCCRGESLPTESALLRELERVITMDAERRALIGEEGRRVIEEHYSLDRMTHDHLRFYERLYPYRRDKYNRSLILGYHGFGNVGDDAVLGKMVEGIRQSERDAGITVLSANVKKTEGAFSVSAVSRKRPLCILRALFACEVLYVGGGTLLQTKTSRRSLWYYLLIIRLAKLFGKTVVFWANGIGKLTSKEQRTVARVLATKSVISLRDEVSYYKTVALLGQIREKKRSFWQENKKTRFVLHSADSAINLLPCTRYHVEALLGKHKTRKFFVVATNGCVPKACRKRYEKRMAAVVTLAAEKGFLPVFLDMHPKKDKRMTKLLEAHLKAAGYDSLTLCPSPREAAGLVSLAEFVLSSRLHPLIFASAFVTRAIAYSDDDKILQFAKDAFGDEARIRLEASDEHRLTEAMLSMLIVKTLPSQVALFAPNPLYAEGMKSRAAELPTKLNAAIIKMALEKKKESALFLKRRASDSSQG